MTNSKALKNDTNNSDNELLEVGNDYQRAGEINKERVDLEPIVEKAREYRQTLKSLEEARAILETEKDAELRRLAEADIAELSSKVRNA